MNPRSQSIEPLRAPRVTVLMAVYNGSAYLRQSVESILAQSFRDFEFLIINDGSIDDSRAILASYDDSRICIIENSTNMGLTKSLNRGLANARGGLIARQDADDVSDPTRLEKQVAFMDAHVAVALLGAQARYINEQGAPRNSRLWWKATTPESMRFQFLFDSPFVHTSVMFRRAVIWDTLGGYNETYRMSQDFELWSRLLESHEARNLPDILVNQRSHSAAMSANRSQTNAHRVARVFQSNLNTVLGANHGYQHWPALWVRVTHSKSTDPLSSAEVFGTINAIYNSFPKRGLPAGTRAEIRLLRSSILLLAARLCAQHGRIRAVAAALRAALACPSLAIGELHRAFVTVLIRQAPSLGRASITNSKFFGR